MIPNMPSVGIRFDIGKMNAASHAADAWKAFWQAVDPAVITGSLLFDGDVAGDVFCIAVQSMDTAALAAVEDAVSASDECKGICADPMIAKGEDATKDPLSMAGNVDSTGNLVGEPGVALSALTAARPQKGAAQPEEAGAGPAPPPGAQPVSQLRRGFPARATTIGSHAARAALSGGTFGQTASSAPKTSAVATKKSSVGKTILTIVVAIVVLGLIVFMIFGPEPPGERPLEVNEPAPKARAEKPAPSEVTDEASEEPTEASEEPAPAAGESQPAAPAADETDAATDADAAE